MQTPQLLVLTYCNLRLQNVRVDTQNPLEIAKRRLGLARIARICKVSRAAAQKWQAQGFLPRTEWTAETNYAQLIAAEYAAAVAADPQSRLEKVPELTADMLLSVRPSTTQRPASVA